MSPLGAPVGATGRFRKHYSVVGNDGRTMVTRSFSWKRLETARIRYGNGLSQKNRPKLFFALDCRMGEVYV
jgi:hypothetical protein